MSATAARHAMEASRPRSRHAHLVRTGQGDHLFVADGSRLYDIDPGLVAALEHAMARDGEGAVADLLVRLGLGGRPMIDDVPIAPPTIHALSLAVAQKCNLGCSYCYAEQGGFGAAPRNMTQADAERAVDLLVADAPEGGRISLAFLGGEPLANRAVIRQTTRHAVERAAAKGLDVGFSITTNGTLLTEDDGAFFEAHGFAVTISLDGDRTAHDRLRPFAGGGGSFDRIMARTRPLIAMQRRMQVSARVTVTPDNLALRETLDAFVAEGFHSVGFAPMLASPNGRDEMQPDDLAVMLEGMIDCGRAFEAHARAGRRYPFLNMLNLLREIGRGTHRPYPCGAGAGYLGVSADGALAACHRFVGDPAGAMGSLADGADAARRAEWLAQRHVHTQAPCRDCWARYLCGGGCHHEVIARGRPACDYIRGWLDYGLGAWLRLSEAGVTGAPATLR
ncbi:radical SAM/SPASM domain-containing protein [Rhodobaculum claviforme]|uniref:Radical SAM protein n=1 Tax=Rhodobaculum claviforme TaxID=1549854 RepID=A0A934TLN2_9RHOB|nr:radical SAM protein [Rhodobaculum claviforme]MBK5928400.1 radical SAM protein [Rhodobaculum claviforme]